MNNFRLLALGDVCGPLAVKHLRKNLWSIRKKYKIDCVIANGENSAEPNGIDSASASMLFESGVDVISTGNHVFRKSCAFKLLNEDKRVIRPLNYPSSSPGVGDTVLNINGYKILFLNVLGQMYIEAPNCPFDSVERALKRNAGLYDFAVLDIHAEATGEKKAIAYEFADKISVIFGTHTHVQTSDAQILDGKCAYLTDLGMCGATDGILGVKKEAVIYRLKTKMLSKFDFAEGEMEIDGAIFEIDTDTGHGVSCEPIKIIGDLQ